MYEQTIEELLTVLETCLPVTQEEADAHAGCGECRYIDQCRNYEQVSLPVKWVDEVRAYLKAQKEKDELQKEEMEGVDAAFDKVIADIRDLLEETSPRVLTQEELKNNVDNPCWFESHGTYMGYEGFWIIPYAFTAWETMYYVFPLMQINERGDSHYSELGLSAYNKAWRCWTSRPTDEQRKVVKWE